MALFGISFPGNKPFMFVAADSPDEAHSKITEYLSLHFLKFEITEVPSHALGNDLPEHIKSLH